MTRSEDILAVREKLGIRRKEFSDALCFTREQEKMLKEWETGKLEVPDEIYDKIKVEVVMRLIKDFLVHFSCFSVKLFNQLVMKFNAEKITQVKNGNGFLFEEYSPEALFLTLKKVIEVYKNKFVWRNLVLNAMKSDFSWDLSAERYIELYNSL